MINFSENVRGAIFMVAAMGLFALEDMFLKSAAQSMSVGLILMLFGAGGTIGFLLLNARSGQPLWHPAMLSRPVLLRALFESVGRLCYTLAIALIPLSSASAILQATPLVVVAGAALFLGERVGWHRWAAISAGFVGVLMILRPGLDTFQIASLLALLGVLGFAGRDLATRMAPRGLTNAQLGFCGFVVLIPTGAALLALSGDGVALTPSGFGLVVVATLLGIGAYTALTAAMRTGEVSVVTPFRYSRLLFGVLLGVVVFAERPDAMTLLGSTVIIAAGLYSMLRERQFR